MSENPTPALSQDPPELRPAHRLRRFASLRAIGALVLREMSTSYGKSAGGYFWAIAEPVGGIVLLTAIFSIGFRSPPIGTNFAIFYATGIVPFVAYMNVSGKVSSAIGYSKALLAYPATTFMDALIARVLVNAQTQVLVAYLIFTVIYFTQETRTDPQIGGIVLSMLMSLSLAVGVGVVNCFLFAAFPWWRHVWSIVNRPIFLVSCIFFMFDDVPQPYQDWLWFNPLIHVIGQMRKSFYPSYSGDYVSFIYFFSVSLGLTLIGLVFLLRYHRDLQHS